MAWIFSADDNRQCAGFDCFGELHSWVLRKSRLKAGFWRRLASDNY